MLFVGAGGKDGPCVPLSWVSHPGQALPPSTGDSLWLHLYERTPARPVELLSGAQSTHRTAVKLLFKEEWGVLCSKATWEGASPGTIPGLPDLKAFSAPLLLNHWTLESPKEFFQMPIKSEYLGMGARVGFCKPPKIWEPWLHSLFLKLT